MLLDVQHLSSYFFLDEGVLRAVDDVSFTIASKESVALVGESGCGKTIVAMSLLNLMQHPGSIVNGQIFFEGEDLLKLAPDEMRKVRGKGIGMVFQEPEAALNPVHTVGRQITDMLRIHRQLNRQEAEREAIQLLGETGIPEPEKRVKAYPFELSGGMQQRVVIAIALAGRPKLLIADEPTTALDPTVQAEILDLLRFLQHEHEMALLLISHDIGVVAGMAERVMVMYTGKIVENAAVTELFDNPLHPYTKGLLQSAPRLGAGKKAPLRGIQGAVPDFLSLPSGCTFRPRCTLADDDCAAKFPPLESVATGRQCACFKVTRERLQ